MKIADLFGAPRHNVVPSIMSFPPIDVEGVAKRLRLRERAVERGRRNLPNTTDSNLDAVEQEIVSEIETEGNTQFNEYLEHQKTYADRIGSAGVQSLALQIGATTDSAITDFERNTRVGTGDLHALRRDVSDSEKELKQFRERHELLRPARNQGAKSLKVGVLIFILALESILNGYFFAKGNSFGYIGGVSQALIIAALNVSIGFAVGRFVFPWLFRRALVARLLAGLGTLIYLVAMLGFNLAVAHYRSAVTTDPFEASTVAFQSLTSHPLAISDLQSWALLLVGALFSLVAAVDGCMWDDPYPGYGSRVRQNLAALEDYNALKDELLGELENIKKAAEETLEDILRQIDNRRGEFGHVVLKSQSLKSTMQQHFAHLETAANSLLRIYRDENSQARTSPAPPHFDDRCDHQWPSLDGQIAPDRTELDAAVAQAISELPLRRGQLHAAYRVALAEYRKIDDLVEHAEAA